MAGFNANTLSAPGFPHIKRDEVVRLLLQSLNDLGYSQSVSTLESESGIILESATITQFKAYVSSGNWEKVKWLIPELQLDVEQTELVQFAVCRQQYLEYIELGLMTDALDVLRHELARFSKNIGHERLHHLASLLMHRSKEDLQSKADYKGVEGGSRLELLHAIQDHIPSCIMIPDHRLFKLLQQAQDYQVTRCVYHNATHPHISLYADHVCARSHFPSVASHVLEEHSDEVWFISFSHDGMWLGSASKDATAIVWDISASISRFKGLCKTFKPAKTLSGHTEAISFLAWSPDDRHVLTASNDKSLKLWDVQSGLCEQTYARHQDVVTSCAWLPSGYQFVSGSQDKYIYLWNIHGQVLHRWSGVRVHDLSVNHDGRWLIAITERKMMMYSLSTPSHPTTTDESTTELEDMPLIATLVETDPITSVSISEEGRYALVNLCTQEIHLWDLEQRKSIRKYIGQKQGRFVIRSCFGGMHQGFVLSGSEDSHIYVWHRQRGELLEQLSGHSGCVNCVAWNPRLNMFASASDDHSIRIWTTE